MGSSAWGPWRSRVLYSSRLAARTSVDATQRVDGAGAQVGRSAAHESGRRRREMRALAIVTEANDLVPPLAPKELGVVVDLYRVELGEHRVARPTMGVLLQLPM